MSKEDSLDEIYNELWSATSNMFGQGHRPLAVAGVMMVQALTLYKTLLTPDEFDSIVSHISETKEQVQPLNLAKNTLQ
jgi:hypothetical protein